MRITMMGAGYVGLVSGACLADFGHEVMCFDTDADKVAMLNMGALPLYEPGLDALLLRNTRERRLQFTAESGHALRGAEVIFIAVGTPSRRGDGYADLTYVDAAARAIAPHLGEGFTTIVTKSTVPVGTGDRVEALLRDLRPDADFAVVSNPEFLREGAAIEDFKHPDRIVVGTTDERARKVMAEVYRPLHLHQGPLLFTQRRTAELIKYAANAFLAMKITFINEMATLCDAVNANVQDVAHGIGLDNRIGRKFLHAGPGYGGSCFPKDTTALMKLAQDAGVPLQLVETTVAVNAARKQHMVDIIVQALGGAVAGKTVAVLGLTFKPNTDDMRDAPSLTIIPALQERGAHITAYDPKGMEHASTLLKSVVLFTNAYDSISGVDALIILTEWDEFRGLDLQRVRASMKRPVVVDLRNIYQPAVMREHGFDYTSLGRPSV